MNLVRLLALAACLAAVALPGTAVAQAPPTTGGSAHDAGWKLELLDYLKVDPSGSSARPVGTNVTVAVTEYSPSNAIQVTLASKSGKRSVDGLKPAPADERVVLWEGQYFKIRFLGMKDANQQALVEVWLRE